MAKRIIHDTARVQYSRREAAGRVNYQADVRIEIDVTELLRIMGPTAASSAGGKSIEAGGLVTVRRVGKPQRMNVVEEG